MPIKSQGVRGKKVQSIGGELPLAWPAAPAIDSPSRFLIAILYVEHSIVGRRLLYNPFCSLSLSLSLALSPRGVYLRGFEAECGSNRTKGCPNWEVGIMGRINMQGLDTCGRRYEKVEEDEDEARENGRRRCWRSPYKEDEKIVRELGRQW